MALTPITYKLMAELLLKTDLVCKNKAEDETDTKLRVAVFSDKLLEFPSDCVKEVFNDWMEKEKWTPSLSEILERVKTRSKSRYALRSALKGLYLHLGFEKSEKEKVLGSIADLTKGFSLNDHDKPDADGFQRY